MFSKSNNWNYFCKSNFSKCVLMDGTFVKINLMRQSIFHVSRFFLTKILFSSRLLFISHQVSASVAFTQCEHIIRAQTVLLLLWLFLEEVGRNKPMLWTKIWYMPLTSKWQELFFTEIIKMWLDYNPYLPAN